MVRLIPLLLLALLLGSGCATSRQALPPVETAAIAILLYEREPQGLPRHERHELQRVLHWLDRDLVGQLRERGYATTPLKEMKEYEAEMGALLIISVDGFSAGRLVRRPRGLPTPGPATLDLSYRLLDPRGALLGQWRDGAHSHRGGTYCAQTLNQRAMARVVTLLAQN
jgi:hypothetical protein